MAHQQITYVIISKENKILGKVLMGLFIILFSLSSTFHIIIES